MNFIRHIFPCTLMLMVLGFKYYLYKRSEPFFSRIKFRRKKQGFQLENVHMQGSSLVGDLIGYPHRDEFELVLSIHEADIVHLCINDKQKARHSFNPLDYKNGTGEICKFTTINNDCIAIKTGNYEISISLKPLLIIIRSSQSDLIWINSKGFLTIENSEPRVAVGLDIEFPQASKAYGLPLRATGMSLKSHNYRLFNNDKFAYPPFNPQPLYGSVPILYAFSPNKHTVGAFWMNSSDTYVDVSFLGGVEGLFCSESGVIDVTLLLGPTLGNCVQQFGKLTGVAPLPPLWSLGYHQSRYSYMSTNEVEEICKHFDKNDLPLDAVWMDIDCTDGKRYFTWNPDTYFDTNHLFKYLEANGRRQAIVIIDPHIKVDNNYFVYRRMKSYFVKKPNQKEDYEAKCWPGKCCWIDFSKPHARESYSKLVEEFINATPNLHVWNDMNEPAVFDTVEKTFPKGVLHYQNRPHRDIHNLYGFYQTMATYEALKRRGKRPFVLTRSHFVGNQKFAAVWSGDNAASWEHLKLSVPMALTEALAGISFNGADVGGFANRAGEELLVRWYQLGAWLPFFRGHCNFDVPRREPYLLSFNACNLIRQALRDRYRHLPYWYTQFFQHYQTAEPVIRPLVYHYPSEDLCELDDQFLVGSDILICPITERGAEKICVYLPGRDEVWFYHLEEEYEGNQYLSITVDLQSTPIFYRGGSIIPIKQPKRSTASMKDDPFTLLVFINRQNVAKGLYYNDDNDSFDYCNKMYTYVRFNYKNSSISNQILNENSHYEKNEVVNSIILYGLQESFSEALFGQENGYKLKIKGNNCAIIDNINIDITKQFVIDLIK